MLRSDVNSQRLGPYNNFKFRVRLDGRIVAGFSKMVALMPTPGVVEHRKGGDVLTSRKSPVPGRFEAITLEHGMAHDPDFVTWANMTNNLEPECDAAAWVRNSRKDIIIEIYSETGQLSLAYKVYCCWVSKLQAVPDLDADENALAIEMIKLENEGWRRDIGVTESESQPADDSVA